MVEKAIYIDKNNEKYEVDLSSLECIQDNIELLLFTIKITGTRVFNNCDNSAYILQGLNSIIEE